MSSWRSAFGSEDAGIIDSFEVCELLATLADKSLVVPDQSTGRYRLIETVRQYAGHQLADREEREMWSGRHLAYFQMLAVEAKPHLAGAEQQVWLDRLESEHENLRAALMRGRDDERWDPQFFELANALTWFWYLRGHWSEGRDWLDLAETRSRGMAENIRLRTAYSAAVLAHAQTDYDAAIRHYNTSLQIARELGDDSTVAWCLGNLAIISLEMNDRTLCEDRAEESIALFRRIGDGTGIAAVSTVLGEIAYAREDYLSAHAHFTEGLKLSRGLQDRAGATRMLSALGTLALKQDDAALAGLYLREAIITARDLHLRSRLPDILDSCAHLSLIRSRPEQSARLLAAAQSIRHGLGASVLPYNRPDHDRILRETEAALADGDFPQAWQTGLAMTMEQAIELALDVG